MNPESLPLATGEDAAEAYILAAMGVPLTDLEVGCLYGVSRSRIQQIHQRALRRLRKALAAMEQELFEQ